jgi:hypothetical protein
MVKSTGLSSGVNYDIKIKKAVDIFYNKSIFSNIVNLPNDFINKKKVTKNQFMAVINF